MGGDGVLSGRGGSPLLYSDELPFNSAPLADRFVWGKPSDPVPCSGRCWILICREGILIDLSSGKPKLPTDPLPLPPESLQNILPLGILDDMAVVSATIDSLQLPSHFMIEPFNARRDTLPPDILALGGTGNALGRFDRESRFCGFCGASTTWLHDEWGKGCTVCRGVRYPASSPCAIVLVHRGDELLLVRKPEWPQGRYSLVAGFLSPGESLEECARREVREETGIVIGYPAYVASQYWPFPSQLMTGFFAEYREGEIRCADGELEDARWFHCHELPDSLPGRRSIARMMIDRFISR